MANFLETCRAAGGLRNLLESGKDGGQEFRIIGGAQQVSQRLADYIGGENVHLGSPVYQISQSTESVTVVTMNGTRFVASHVILAMAPHLVVRINFQPPLPTWRDQLGQQMPVGHLIKVVITYRQAFWRQRGYSGQGLSSRGPLCTVFDACSADGKTPALVGFIGGAQAIMWATIVAEDRREAVLEQIAQFFDAQEALVPLDYAEKDWAKEVYNGGCPVVHMNPGTAATLAWRLRESVGRIHFAGTELATTWSGFLNGAVESGQRAAEDVLALLRAGHDIETGAVEHFNTPDCTPYPLFPTPTKSLLQRIEPVLCTVLSFSVLSAAIRFLSTF